MNEQIFDGLDLDSLVATACKYTKNLDDSEDCTQQALLTAWERRADIKYPAAFLRTKIHSAFIDSKRRENVRLKYAEKLSHTSEYAKSADYLLQLKEFSEKAERLIQELTSVQRRTLEYKLLDYSVAEIAKIMKANPGTIMSRLFYIRAKLQKELAEYEDLVEI